MRQFVKRVIEPLVRFVEETLPAIFMLMMVLIVCYAVVSRYAFARPIGWANEITVGLFIWTIFLGAAGAGRYYLHIGVEALVNFLPGRWRAAQTSLVNIIVIGLLLLASQLAWSFAQGATKLLQLTGIGYVWIYSAVPVGFLLLAVHQVPRLVDALRGVWTGAYEAPSSIAAFANLSEEATGVDRDDEAALSTGAVHDRPSSSSSFDGPEAHDPEVTSR